MESQVTGVWGRAPTEKGGKTAQFRWRFWLLDLVAYSHPRFPLGEEAE